MNTSALPGRTLIALLPALLMGVSQGHAQGMNGGIGGHVWPTDTGMVTVTGTVHVDTSGGYALDTDGDAVADFVLEFGPTWYHPASGTDRPADGATITVSGAVLPQSPTPTLVVFDVNGNEWRIPNEYGPAGWMMESHWSTPGDVVTETGVVRVDSTYFYRHYYLDVDSDGAPEYRLGLGPMWFIPVGGAEWPLDGTTVEVRGWVSGGGVMPTLMVVELNGAAWRPETGPASWAGSWMAAGHADTFYAYCVTDESSSIAFPPGHMGSQMGGMGGWPDSSFVQFWNVPPDSLPGTGDGDVVMGFYVDFQDPHGDSMMTGSWSGGMGAGRVQFSGTHTIRLHYTDEDLDAHGVAESSLEMHWWDKSTETWRVAATAVRDMSGNTLSWTTNELVSYYSLSGGSAATASERGDAVPAEYLLHQNYPNPFNPSTTIGFDVPSAGRVVLRVFDSLGRTVATPFDQVAVAGPHQIRFDAGALPSGVYVYRLEFDGRTESRIFTLLR